MTLQMAMFTPKSEWIPPESLPDLSSAKTIAIDVETKDPDIKQNGPGWPQGNGEIVGYAVAVNGAFFDTNFVRQWIIVKSIIIYFHM